MYGIREIVEYARANGPFGLTRAGIRQLVVRWERLILISRSLEEPIPAGPLPEGVECRPATLEDVDELHSLLSGHGFWRSTATLRSQIGGQGFLLLATHGGRIIGFACATGDMPEQTPALRRAVQLGPDEAWGAGVFVAPEHRGRGIASALVLAVMDRCRAAGYRRVCSFVRARDAAARSANGKAGYREVGEVLFWRLLFLSGAKMRHSTEDGNGTPHPQPRGDPRGGGAC